MDDAKVNLPADGENVNLGAWLMRNGLTVALVAVLIGWLYKIMGIDGVINIAEAAIGLGFLIFIHELGHFLVAKWCDVHVETFSIGFGPAIPGCSFRRGETFYKFAWFPLGGYVKMVGEGPEDDENEDDPRSFKNKPVWQRMAIISAGVVMNTATSFLLFILIFMTHGAERAGGGIGAVDCGSPGWQAGIHSGTRIVRINDIRDPYFDDVQQEILTTPRAEALTIVTVDPEHPSQETEVRVVPRREKDEIKPAVGILPPLDLKLFDKAGSYALLPLIQESAAAQATPAFAFGDKIVGTTDPADPGKVKPIADDYGEFYERQCQLAKQPMVVRVERTAKGSKTEIVDVKVPVQGTWTFGLRMRMGHVVALRKGSPAQAAGLHPRDLPAGIEGDIIKEVELPEPDGTVTRFVTSRASQPAAGEKVHDLDPERLPFEMEQWARRRKPGATPTLVVLQTVDHAERQPVRVPIGWDDSYQYNRELPFMPSSPLSVPGLGLAYRIETFVDAVEPGSPAQAQGVREGDVIKAIRFREAGKKIGENVKGSWRDLENDQWASAFWTLQQMDFKELDLRLERDKIEVTLQAQPDTSWPQPERGLHLMAQIRYQKADSPMQAIVLGMHMTINNIQRIFQNLLAVATGRISGKNFGGPIMIAQFTYRAAGESIFTFLQLLAIISINLAVINFLPIPVLDGGHMVFLSYELIRGRPASEQFRVIATYAGLFMILSLMAFVVYLDISRY